MVWALESWLFDGSALDQDERVCSTVCEGIETRLKKKHAVAVAEKTVLLLYCVGISGQHSVGARIASCKCANQHEKRGLREVKIGEEAADNLKFVAWADEDAGLAGVR